MHFPPLQITETYAFLPREAVSKFLSLCTQCKKQQITENTGQMHVTMANVSNYNDNRYLTSNLSDTTLIKHERKVGLNYKIKSDWEEEKSNSELVGNLSSEIGFANNQASRTLFKPYENNNNKYGDSPKSIPVNPNLNDTLNYYQLLTIFYHNFNLTNSSSSQKLKDIKTIPSNMCRNSNQFINSETMEKDSQKIKISTNDEISCNELKIPDLAKAWVNVHHSPNVMNRKTPQLATSTPEPVVKSFSDNNKSKTREDGSEAVKQMTSTYLSMTRSLGLEDDDALNLVS